mgnify:CR=1 FL=1
MVDVGEMYRREVLAAVGTGISTAAAGCSGNNENTENPGTDGSSTSEQTDGQSQKENSGNGEDTSTGEGANTPDGGDQIHEGEEEFESFLASNEYEDSFPRGQWLEFEEPSEYITVPFDEGSFENGASYIETGEDALGEFDSLYLAFDLEKEFIHVYTFHADEWDTEISAAENFTSGNAGGESRVGSYEGEDELETILSENFQGYDDASEEFPQEYLDLVEE